MRSLLVTLISAATAAVVPVAPAYADREPTDQERQRIEAELRKQGFTDWDDLELEDDESVWKVDDAKAADGQEYDLHLNPGSLAIVKREAD